MKLSSLYLITSASLLWVTTAFAQSGWLFPAEVDLGPQIEGTTVDVVTEYIWPGVTSAANLVDSGEAKHVKRAGNGFEITRSVYIDDTGSLLARVRFPGRTLETTYKWSVPKLGAYLRTGEQLLYAGGTLSWKLTTINKDYALYSVSSDYAGFKNLRLVRTLTGDWEVLADIPKQGINQESRVLINLQQKWPQLKTYSVEATVIETAPISILKGNPGWKYVKNHDKVTVEVEIDGWSRSLDKLKLTTDVAVKAELLKSEGGSGRWTLRYLLTLVGSEVPKELVFTDEDGKVLAKQRIKIF